MGLKFERKDDLDKLFDSFAIDPKKKELPKEKEIKQEQPTIDDSENKKQK